jgi:hypothetical protein
VFNGQTLRPATSKSEQGTLNKFVGEVKATWIDAFGSTDEMRDQLDKLERVFSSRGFFGDKRD